MGRIRPALAEQSMEDEQFWRKVLSVEIENSRGGRLFTAERKITSLKSELQKQQIQLDELKKTLTELQRQQQLERQQSQQQSRKHQQLQRELLRQQPYRLVKI